MSARETDRHFSRKLRQSASKIEALEAKGRRCLGLLASGLLCAWTISPGLAHGDGRAGQRAGEPSVPLAAELLTPLATSAFPSFFLPGPSESFSSAPAARIASSAPPAQPLIPMPIEPERLIADGSVVLAGDPSVPRAALKKLPTPAALSPAAGSAPEGAAASGSVGARGTEGASGADTGSGTHLREVLDLSDPDSVDVRFEAVEDARTTAIPRAPDLPLPTGGIIVRVIDGDTYVLADGSRIRLAGVNTPEKKERIGPRVKQEATRILLNKEVTLQYGLVTRDGYGRLIAEVFIEGQSVSELLIRNGWAHLFLIPPTRPANYEALVAAQKEARARRLGMWSEDGYQGELHITSFHANARGNDRDNPQGEYLRVANTSGIDLNLKGYRLTNQKGRVLKLPDIVIPAGYTFQVVSGRGEIQGSQEKAYKIFWNSEGPVWNNDEDVATLLDPQGRRVDGAEHAPKRSHPKVSP